MANPRYDLSGLLTDGYAKTFAKRSVKGDFGCLQWTGPLSPGGYGYTKSTGVSLVAHRVAWILHHQQDIPGLLVIDHLCGNTRCVNPPHLEAVTNEENGLRVLTPPPGWMQVDDVETFGRRRRPQTKAELAKAARPRRVPARKKPPALSLLPGAPLQSLVVRGQRPRPRTATRPSPTVRIRQGKHQVRWREVVGDQVKQRGRSFVTRGEAEQFMAELSA